MCTELTNREKTKYARAPKYVHALLELMTQVHYLLPPKLAYELIWNRCVNHRGHPNSNFPNDLDIEYCNGYFKHEINSYRGEISERASHVSRFAAMHDTVATNYDNQSNIHKPSGKHATTGNICKIYRYEYAMLALYYTVVYVCI